MGASVLSEIEALFAQRAEGRILQRQTTRLDMESHSPREPVLRSYRVHFRGKHDLKITGEGFRSFRVLERHPLLLEYTDPGGELHLASKIRNMGPLIADMRAAADEVFGGWRSLDHYVNPDMSLEELLSDSYGLLLRGPKPLTDRIRSVADQHGLALTFFVPNRQPVRTAIPKLLLLDRSFVIADRFEAERLLPRKMEHDRETRG